MLIDWSDARALHSANIIIPSRYFTSTQSNTYGVLMSDEMMTERSSTFMTQPTVFETVEHMRAEYNIHIDMTTNADMTTVTMWKVSPSARECISRVNSTSVLDAMKQAISAAVSYISEHNAKIPTDA